MRQLSYQTDELYLAGKSAAEADTRVQKNPNLHLIPQHPSTSLQSALKVK